MNSNGFKYKFDKLTSNNGKSWLLALNWILFLEFLSSILELKFLDVSKNYIEYLPDGLYKELSIAFMVVLFIWYSVYSFVSLKKESFFIFTLYSSLCVYLLITHDLSFSLLLHNLNLFEVFENGFGFYLSIQLLIKFIIVYLFFKMIVSFKNRNLQE